MQIPSIEPRGQIYLLSMPLYLDYKHQLTFETEHHQYDYFVSKRQLSLSATDVSYIRKDNIIKVPFHIDTLWKVNYIMYQNSNFLDKWFYAFILNKEYVNDNCTAIRIQTDVWQTWQFDIQILESFVEREMIPVSGDYPRCKPCA